MAEKRFRGTFEGVDVNLLGRFLARVDFNGPAHPYRDDLPPCWIWTGSLNTSGYGRLWVRGRSVGAHRLAWEWENGRPPGEALVLHSCDNRACVNPAHLRLGDARDNAGDMVERGRNNPMRGADNGNGKLTGEDALRVIVDLQSGLPGKDAAARYGINRPMVSHIRHRNRWQHLHRLLDDLVEALRENAAARAAARVANGWNEEPPRRGDDAGAEEESTGADEDHNPHTRQESKARYRNHA